MQRLGELWRTLVAMVGRRRLDRDLAEEMRFHLEMKAGEHRAAGMPADEARRAAERRFGNLPLLQEDSSEAWGWGAAERLWQDAKYALRMLAKNRKLTALAAVTLALGIGANTVIFSVVQAVLLAPLPYGAPDRLGRLWGSNRGSNRVLM